MLLMGLRVAEEFEDDDPFNNVGRNPFTIYSPPGFSPKHISLPQHLTGSILGRQYRLTINRPLHAHGRVILLYLL